MSQNYVEVTIGGKNYRLATSQNKGSDYIQQLAHYIDTKLNEITSESGANIVYKDAFPILFALNIAEDLFNEREKFSDTEFAKREEELTSQLDKLNKKLEIYRTQDNENKVRWDNLISQLQTASAENKELQQKLDESNALVEKYGAENKVFEEQLSEKLVTVNELNQKISAKNQELNALSLKLASKNTILNELNTKSAERNQKLNAVNKERDDLLIKLKENKAVIADYEEKLANCENKMQLGSKGYSSLQKEKTELDREVIELKQENSRLKENCEALTRENTKLSADYKALKSKKRV